MVLVAEVTPNQPFVASPGVFTDWGGVLRYTTSTHPNMPSPDPGTGIAVLSTGKNGAPGGEVNVGVADTVHRYVIECLVSEPDLVAELSDGVNVQIANAVIDRPSPDEILASFVTPKIVSGNWTNIRIYHRGTFTGGQPAVDSWALFRIRVFRVDGV